MVCDGGHWLRQNTIKLSKFTNTPIAYWLSLPLRKLAVWIKDSNVVVVEFSQKK